MDYAWEYLSVAVQHGLKYVKLNDHINLGNYKYDDFYKQAEVKVTGKKPGTWKTLKGTILHLRHHHGQGLQTTLKRPRHFFTTCSPRRAALRSWKDMGQPPFIPARVTTEEIKTVSARYPCRSWSRLKIRVHFENSLPITGGSDDFLVIRHPFKPPPGSIDHPAPGQDDHHPRTGRPYLHHPGENRPGGPGPKPS